MADNGDKIFLFFLILFEIILLFVFLINTYYFATIQKSNNSGISTSTASSLSTVSIFMAIFILICLIATCVFLKNEMTRYSEVVKLQEDVKMMTMEKDDPNIPKVKGLISALSKSKKEIESQKRAIEARDVTIHNYENDLSSIGSVLQNKTQAYDDLLQEYESFKEQHGDTESETSSNNESHGNVEEILEENADRQDKDDEIVIPEDADDEETYEPVELKKPGVKWNSADGGSFLEKLLREHSEN